MKKHLKLFIASLILLILLPLIAYIGISLIKFVCDDKVLTEPGMYPAPGVVTFQSCKEDLIEKIVSKNPPKNLGYMPGELIVSFKEETEYYQAIEVLKSYDLNDFEEPIGSRGVMDKSNIQLQSYEIFLVKVPVGEEEKYIEILETNNLIFNASLNHITTIN